MDFYQRAGIVLDLLDQKRGSIKSLCMNEGRKSQQKTGKTGDGKRFLKVILTVLKYRTHLTNLITQSRIIEKEPDLFIPPKLRTKKAAGAADVVKNRSKPDKAGTHASPMSLACIMIYDMLFAKRGLTLPKEHKLRLHLETYKPALDKIHHKELRKQGAVSLEEVQDRLPERVASSIKGIGKDAKESVPEPPGSAIRWMRVNANHWSMEDALDWLESTRWTLVESLEAVEKAGEHERVYSLDDQIEPLLAFPRWLKLQTLSAYKDGRLIAQDKASCFPPWVLLYPDLPELLENEYEPDLDSAERRKKRKHTVLDATAAPGNKTSMLSALVKDMGRVIAVERDLGRFKVLKEMCTKADCGNVQFMNVDFLKLDPASDKLKNVSHILVDPSCSGSGINNRFDEYTQGNSKDESADAARLASLANFQVAILSHALSFQGARRVVYSTCSIHDEENERVVQRILAKPAIRDAGWRLAPRDFVMPGWPMRGKVLDGDAALADSVVRSSSEHGTIGFFVACFERDIDSLESDEQVEGEVVEGEADNEEAEDGNAYEAEGDSEAQPGDQAYESAFPDEAEEWELESESEDESNKRRKRNKGSRSKKHRA